MNDFLLDDKAVFGRIVLFLKKHDDYLLLTHRRPDGDTLGSAAALCLGLRALGKTAYLWENPGITQRYLPFVKDLIAPEGFSYGKAVSLDTAAPLMLRDWDGTADLRIDHHPGSYAEFEYTDPEAAACGEIVYDLLEALGVELTPEIAAPLYLSVSTDTGCFRYSNTTAKTHRIAAALIDTGIDSHMIDAVCFAKTRARLKAEAAIISNITYHAGGRVAVSALTLEGKDGAGEDDLDGISSMVQNIEGVYAGLMLREETDCWRVSCRTKAPYSANEICGVLGGGGHMSAAGADIPQMPLEAARERVLAALFGTYPKMEG